MTTSTHIQVGTNITYYLWQQNTYMALCLQFENKIYVNMPPTFMKVCLSACEMYFSHSANSSRYGDSVQIRLDDLFHILLQSNIKMAMCY